MNRFTNYGLVIAVVTAVALIFSGCATSYEVTSISMEPTMMEGDSFSIEPIEQNELRRGDIVLYSNMRDEDELHVKRIIALPGETIEIKDGQIFIDGELLTEAFETVPLHKERTLELETIEVNRYFVMGDNRPNSFDSRIHGAIKFEQIKGRALLPNRAR